MTGEQGRRRPTPRALLRCRRVRARRRRRGRASAERGATRGPGEPALLARQSECARPCARVCATRRRPAGRGIVAGNPVRFVIVCGGMSSSTSCAAIARSGARRPRDGRRRVRRQARRKAGGAARAGTTPERGAVPRHVRRAERESSSLLGGPRRVRDTVWPSSPGRDGVEHARRSGIAAPSRTRCTSIAWSGRPPRRGRDLVAGVRDHVEEDFGLGDRPDRAPRAAPRDRASVAQVIRDARRRAESFRRHDGKHRIRARAPRAARRLAAGRWARSGGLRELTEGENLDAVWISRPRARRGGVRGLLDAPPPAQQRGGDRGPPPASTASPRWCGAHARPQARAARRAQEARGGEAEAGACSARSSTAPTAPRRWPARRREAAAQAIEVLGAANGGVLGAAGRMAAFDGLGTTGRRSIRSCAVRRRPRPPGALLDAVRSARATTASAARASGSRYTRCRPRRRWAERELSTRCSRGADAIAAAEMAVARDGDSPRPDGAHERHGRRLPIVGGYALHGAYTATSGRRFSDRASTTPSCGARAPPGRERRDLQARRERIARPTPRPRRRWTTCWPRAHRGSADHRLIEDLVDDGTILPSHLAHFAITGTSGPASISSSGRCTIPRPARR